LCVSQRRETTKVRPLSGPTIRTSAVTLAAESMAERANAMVAQRRECSPKKNGAIVHL
jgi:hypothetical protein